MKAKAQSGNPAQDMPADMFGLGIQVFKIDSKKDTSNHGSAGKMRQNIKNLENPAKKTNTALAHIPKSKKISGVLPNIHNEQQKSFLESGMRTNSITGKKPIEKRLSSMNKIQSIKEVLPKKQPGPQPNPKTTNSNQATVKNPLVNKTLDDRKKPQQPIEAEEEKIVKLSWNQSLNQIIRFYSEGDMFRKQQASKVGKKKNQEFLDGQQSFVQAYVERESQLYEFSNDYDPHGIQNYGERFEHLDYENYVLE